MNQAANLVVSRRRALGLGSAILATATITGCSSDGGSGAQSSGTPQTVNATSENVRLIGRTYEEDGATWLPQSGSALEFEATATSIKIQMVGDENVDNEADLRPRFAVLVDGEVVLDDTLSESPHTVEVPLDEPLDGGIVEVIHLSEANRGIVGVRSVTVESNVPSPIAPTVQKDLSIGFIGDSITCAYGVEATSNDDPYTTTTQNFMKSYAYLTAQELDADYETVCYSGYGIVSGWSGDGERNEDMLMPPIYDLVANGHKQTWDFAAHPHHVIVMNVGTNDFTYTGTDEARIQEFAQGYTEFLARVRELNPESFIICTLGTMWGCEVLYPSLEQAIGDFRENTGDTRVVCYLSEPLDKEVDGWVANGHPNEKGQREIAQLLVSVIREVLKA